MRASGLILIVWVLSSFSRAVFALEPGEAALVCFQKGDHPAIRGCLEQEAENSEKRLTAAVASMKVRVEKSRMEPTDKNRVLEAAKETMKSFRVFRDNQCEFAWATAEGGNGAQDKRLACTSLLNDTQTSTWNSYVPETQSFLENKN